MYKLMIALAAAATLLTACNSDEESKKTAISEQSEQKPTEQEKHPDGEIEAAQKEETQQIVETEETQKQESQKEVDQMASVTTANEDNWSSLPEYNTLMKQVGNGDYTFSTETDNPGKRVLLIKDNDKQYKSIFVKKTNRLKIININGGGEIFNSVLNDDQ